MNHSNPKRINPDLIDQFEYKNFQMYKKIKKNYFNKIILTRNDKDLG